MQYTMLGNTGVVVSRFAFGAMTFGSGRLAGELDNNIGQTQADEMVAAALDAGVNFFDTADAYTGGQSEEMIGRALKEKRHEVVIATKVGFRSGEALTDSGLSYRHVIGSAEASLKRLGTDYIDLYQLHITDPLTPSEETARALEDLRRGGHVRYAGYSNYPAWKAQRLIGIQERMGYAPLVSAQMYYSLLGRDIEHDTAPFLAANGLGLMVWSPLASGFLTGKYTRERPVPQDARRAKFDFPPIDVERGYDVVERLRALADERDATPARIALAWLLAKPFVTSVIVGASKLDQLRDNLAATEVGLCEAEVAELDELTASPAPYPAWMQGMGWDQRIKDALGGE